MRNKVLLKVASDLRKDLQKVTRGLRGLDVPSVSEEYKPIRVPLVVVREAGNRTYSEPREGTMKKWDVFAEPQGENPSGPPPGKNLGGLVIYMTNGSARHEVGRVLFVRKNVPSTKDQKLTFKSQLRAKCEVAWEAARVANDLIDRAEQARVEAEQAQAAAAEASRKLAETATPAAMV